ncbi:unnamed protein product [Vitrella brassicaformis CCMP3155]|uniref:TLDc domain-containing protein n=1 Tax=Vitrella brassicaformis (strain CCMP3155) TaxID=1169540 RepID=A0A0G4EY49_VITBC|nr:unnamed protein product [Vitrella brassicaformis CCMP3155]|eukprot:CEM03990.1 unnamed protein product [Vitrella brassicaformis CCMP3155]
MFELFSEWEDADALIREFRSSFDSLQERLLDAKTTIEKTLADDIQGMLAAKGAVCRPAEATGEILVNAGGVVYPVSRCALQLPLMKRRYISVLLLYCTEGMPRDPDGRVYLEVSPAWFETFLDELTLFNTGRTDRVALPHSKEKDPAYAEYHDLFMREVGRVPSAHPEHGRAAAAAAASAEPRGKSRSDGAILDGIHDSVDDLANAMKRVMKRKEELSTFLAAMDPFLKDNTEDGSVLLTLEVLGRTCTILKRTLRRLGANHTLLMRFSDTPPCWGDRRVRATPGRHFIHVVEFARRIAVLPKGQYIRPPMMDQAELELFREDLAMYNLSYSPVLDLPAGDTTIIKSAEEWGKVLEMIGKPRCRPTLLYKSSRHGVKFSTMFGRVTWYSGVLFLFQHKETHRFGCFVDGCLNFLTWSSCDHEDQRSSLRQFFISLSGTYPAATKVPLRRDRHGMCVNVKGYTKTAGRECSMVLAGGYLLVAVDPVWSSKDGVLRCYNCFDDGVLPLGQLGDNTDTLAGEKDFTADEVEAWWMEPIGIDWQAQGARYNRRAAGRRNFSLGRLCGGAWADE